MRGRSHRRTRLEDVGDGSGDVCDGCLRSHGAPARQGQYPGLFGHRRHQVSAHGSGRSDRMVTGTARTGSALQVCCEARVRPLMASLRLLKPLPAMAAVGATPSECSRLLAGLNSVEQRFELSAGGAGLARFGGDCSCRQHAGAGRLASRLLTLKKDLELPSAQTPSPPGYPRGQGPLCDGTCREPIVPQNFARQVPLALASENLGAGAGKTTITLTTSIPTPSHVVTVSARGPADPAVPPAAAKRSDMSVPTPRHPTVLVDDSPQK